MAAGELNVLTDDDYKTLSNMFVWLKAVIDMGLGLTGEFLPARLGR